MLQQVKALEEKVKKVTKDTVKYKDRCQALEGSSEVPFNYGKSFDEVQKCQQKGKLQQ